jgi:hypothetical protein
MKNLKRILDKYELNNTDLKISELENSNERTQQFHLKNLNKSPFFVDAKTLQTRLKMRKVSLPSNRKRRDIGKDGLTTNSLRPKSEMMK